MATILATAEPFAFGPVGRLISILKPLSKHHQIHFFGSGSALNLAQKEDYQVIRNIHPTSKRYKDSIKSLAKQADIFISSLDRPSVLTLSSQLPTVYIDGLFWLWQELPGYLKSVDAYIRVQSHIQNPQSTKLAKSIKNLITVGPIIDYSINNSPRLKTLLINFGGLTAKGWYSLKDNPYHLVFTKLLLDHVHLDNFNHVYIVSNQSAIEQLNNNFKSNLPRKVKLLNLSHDQFVDKLSNSTLLISSPGGQTSMEAFASRTPTFFLPPNNDTQYLWLKSFKSHHAAQESIHWEHFYKPLNIFNSSPKTTISKLFQYLDNFSQDQDKQAQITDAINRFIKISSTQKKQVRAQDKYFQSLGGNGLSKATAVIEKIIAKSL